jgi:hypothetical protein
MTYKTHYRFRAVALLLTFLCTAVVFVLLLRAFGALPEVRKNTKAIELVNTGVVEIQDSLGAQGAKLESLRVKVDSLVPEQQATGGK